MNTSWVHASKSLLTALVVGLLLAAAAAENHLKSKAVQQQGFEIIGISARTNNPNEMTEHGAIARMWKRFYSDNEIFFESIPGKTNNSVYAAYTDYASDVAGDYTFVLGARVKPGTRSPEGMIAIQVPAGRYLQFTTQQGYLPTVVPNLWREIYAYFQKSGAPQRAFNTDYETYDAGMDPANATGTIYVGVK